MVKRGWRSRPRRRARGLSPQRRLGGGEAGDRGSRPGCADLNEGPERLSLGNRFARLRSSTTLGILTIFAGFAQFEREMMLERQREGIAKAKAENRYLGRRPSARLKADEAVELFKTGRTVTQIANALGIGRGSVYRALETCGMNKR
jgi:hypothetical protein